MDVTEQVIARNGEVYAHFSGKDTLKRTDKINCSVILLAACQEGQLAQEFTEGGVFTSALQKVWDNGQFDSNYPRFINAITHEIKATNARHSDFNIDQVPDYMKEGVDDSAFERQKPFTI